MTPVILNDLMYERGRGPELRSCRITVYDLIPYLFHEDYTDAQPLEAWRIVTPTELAALKQYIADHRNEVMAKHWEIESRMIREQAAQCTPENLARWHETRLWMNAFRAWIVDRQNEGTLPPAGERRAAFEAWRQACQPVGAGVGS